MVGETPGRKPDQTPRSEASRPRGTLSEGGLAAFIKLLKRRRFNSLKDLLPYLESGFDSLDIANGARDEIMEATQELKDREGNPRNLTVSPAKAVIDGEECMVLVASGSSGSKGLAPASLVASEIVSAAFTNSKRYIKPADIEKGVRHQPGLSQAEAIALTNETLGVLGTLFGFQREVTTELWHHALKSKNVNYRRPTPPEWGNGSIPGTRLRRFNPRSL